MSVMPPSKRPQPEVKRPEEASPERKVLERRIQGLANSAFLRVHNAVAKAAEAPLDLVEKPLDLVEKPLDLVETPPAPAAPPPGLTEKPLDLVAPVPPPVEPVDAAKARSRVAERLARLADQTASRTKIATSQAVAASRTGIAKAAKVSRERVLPGLKERTRPERIAADYRSFQMWLHRNVLDSTIERLVFTPTAGHVPLEGLTIRGENRARGHDYRPVPYWVFKWALAAVEDDPSRLKFIDYGAGKGRALLLASMYPFAAIGGVEFAEELHDNATMNIAQFSRSHMKCRDIECMLEDAANLQIPDEEAIHFFFDPFTPEMFAEILSRIVASYHARPRRLYIIAIDMDVAASVHATGIFQQAPLPPAEGLFARFLSPHTISVYRSLA